MANSIQHMFWGNGTVDGIQDYAEALKAGITGADGTTPLGQVKYYQYRLNRPYDVFRWRGFQGFQQNNRVQPSVADYPTAKFLLGQTVPGHTHAAGVQGTIIALEYTWRTTSPKLGITAASIIRGNFDFGPYSRMLAGSSDNKSDVDHVARWAARPTSFTAPTFGVSYGARSYSSSNFPTDNSWQTSFNPNSVRSGSPGAYSITAGSGSLQGAVGTKDCYSLFEMGLDILYLTSLYPDAVFLLDHVLEVNINHGAAELNDIPQDVNPDNALTRANYSDAVLHIISFLEAMGITNVLHHIGLAGPAFYNGGAAGNNSADPWWGNILAQEKNSSTYGAINSNYATGRTWVHLAGRDMYSGQNGAVAYRSPADLVDGVVSWAHRFDKYVVIFTTGITHLMDTGTPASGAQHATYPKNGTLRQSGTLLDGDNWFSAFRLEGDAEMGVTSPRLWGVNYQIGFESQDPHNDYNPESDSAATNRGTRTAPLPAPPITSGNVYWDATTYDRTTLPPVGARKGWRAFWDWLNAANWKGGIPLLLPASVPDAPTLTAIAPRTGIVGASVVITGTGFTGTSGAAGVKFGTVNATSYVVNSDTQITAVVPAGGYGAVTVTTPTGSVTSTSPDVFSVLPTLRTNSPLAPTSGPVGTSVVIAGTGFTSVTVVTIGAGNTPASFVVNSDSQITAVVGGGSTTGPVKVTAPGGTAATPSSFTVTPVPSPTITSFTPSSGPVGQIVVITGATFTGATAVKFNGVNATSFTVDSSTQITAVAPAGGTGTIAVTTGAGTGVSSGTFTISNAPTISGFSPSSGPIGTTVTITGTHLTGTTAVRFNGISALSFSNVDSTHVTAVVPTGGGGTISLDAPGGTAVSAQGFTITPSGPTITSFTPTSGVAGTSVVITGTNLTAASAVKFNGVNAASYTVNSATQITCAVPSGAGTTGKISVTTAGGTATSTGTFTVTGLPTVNTFTPTSGPIGTSVVITGTNLTGASAVKFNGVNATSYTVDSATQITAVVPAGGGGTIQVTTSAGSATSAQSFAILAPPAVLSFTPTTGAVGASVVITGQRFTGVTGAAGVKFNGVNATSYTVDSDTQITAVVPANGGGLISVTSPNGTGTSSDNFTLTAGPTVTSFSPIFGPVGTTITFVGTNMAAVNLVHFGAGSGAPTSTSSTGVVINVPTGATTAQPILDTPSSGSVTAADPFTVTAGSVPTISGISPALGPVGTNVDITGTNLSTTTAVTFGGVSAASFVVNSGTHVHAVVPPGGSGTVAITATGGTASSPAPFVIEPAVDDFTPTEGSPGDTVTLTGSGFIQAVGVFFGDTPAIGFTIVDDTEITAVVPFSTDGPITVTTAGSSGESADPFAFLTGPSVSYAITYYGATAWGAEHTFEVVAEVTEGGVDKTSADNPTVSFAASPIGIWFVDRLIGTQDDPAVTVQLLGQEDIPSAIGESATTFTPVGRKDPVTITDGIRGYEGTVSGYVQSKADLDALEAMKTAAIDGTPVRLIVSDMNIPVLIGALTIGRIPTEAGFYQVSVEVSQVDEFAVN